MVRLLQTLFQAQAAIIAVDDPGGILFQKLLNDLAAFLLGPLGPARQPVDLI